MRAATRPNRFTPQHLKWLVGCLLMACMGAAQAFGFDDVALRAKQSAATAYKPPADHLPRELRDLEYDAYRDIRYRPEKSLWRGDKLPFELTFFHAGREFRDSVNINEVNGKTIKPIAFEPEDFDYGRNKIDPKAMRDAGFAGFRAHYAINRKDYKDEIVVFLGASYFRGVGKDQAYGLSARGLAVDVATQPGEEFPRFTEYWIERPSPRATTLVIYALLDSKRVTGAYRFEVVPGAETVMNVRGVVYLREPVAKLGLAPLTSMFTFGENQPGQDDFRPEVHDSDGLSVWTGGGEWIWRPLVNPARLLVTSFATTNPHGYGLMQRDRSYGSYEDPDDLYERRPSGWVEPIGPWGAGRVELVQIPTPDETNDNIVAYWVLDKPPAPQQPLNYSYRLHWQRDDKEARPANAWVTQTRRGRGFVRKPDGQLKFVVDFDGPALKPLAPESPIQAMVSVAGNAELTQQSVTRNRVSGSWRVTLLMKRQDVNKPIELRAYLQLNDKPISETWSYIVPSQPPEKP